MTYEPEGEARRLIYRLNTSVTVYNLYLSHDTPTIHCFNSVKSLSPLISIQECDNDLSHCSPLKSVLFNR